MLCHLDEGRMLAALNDRREFHSSPPLKWYLPDMFVLLSSRNEELAMSARNCAVELSQRLNCQLPLYYREKLGTNYLSADLEHFSEALAAQFWYEGHLDYDFKNGVFALTLDIIVIGGPLNRNPNVLSFTQMVWTSTKEVGCAVACCNGRQLVLVCRFHPPGNIQGKFVSNVKEKFEKLKSRETGVSTEL
ncbi:SCP-like extracellular family protein, putative [Babesia ovis]|uniref:SCP-like extracellular family protein, putative n=1 Tax=Babesia ovis TaxID=5869 RepID=A0A9W5T8Z0_BABOV|nr:SCP-like extracellular family protein, putative [Babesia ovis]